MEHVLTLSVKFATAAATITYTHSWARAYCDRPLLPAEIGPPSIPITTRAWLQDYPGTQDPMNSGVSLTTVTVPAWDAAILVTPDAP